MTFGLPPGEQFLGYPVAGPDNDLRPGHRRYNVVWYRPADEATKLQWLLTDERGVTHAISIPPPLIRREAIAEMRADAERLVGAAIPPDRAADRGADPAADLRSGIAAHGVRPGGDRRATPPSSRARMSPPAFPRRRTTRRRWPRRLQREPMSRARSSVSRRRGCRKITASSSARAISAPICRRRRTQEEQARAGRHSDDAAVIAETAVLDFSTRLEFQQFLGVAAADRGAGGVVETRRPNRHGRSGHIPACRTDSPCP